MRETNARVSHTVYLQSEECKSVSYILYPNDTVKEASITHYFLNVMDKKSKHARLILKTIKRTGPTFARD